MSVAVERQVIPEITRWVGALAVSTALILALGSGFVVRLFLLGLVYVVAALGLHVLVNDTGELSLAHGGTLAVGAFAAAHAARAAGDLLGPAAIVVMVLAGVAAGIVVGATVVIPIIRLRGVAVAVVTLIANAAIFAYLLRARWLVGRSSGLTVGDGPLSWMLTPNGQAVGIATLAAVALVVTIRCRGDRFGRACRAVRANPELARANGVDVLRTRIGAHVLAGGLAGLAGTMWMWLHGGAAASGFHEHLSLDLLTLAVLGGPGGLAGPVLVGLGFTLSHGLLAHLGIALSIVSPLLLIVVLVLHPGGLNEQLRGLGALRRRGRPEPDGARAEASVDPAPADAGPPSVRADVDTEPVLQVEQLRVSFGGIRALDGLSMSGHAGEVVGVIGPNGAGKTTFVDVLSGHRRPDRGRIVFDGCEVTGMPAHERAGAGLRRTFQVGGSLADETPRTHMLLGQHRSGAPLEGRLDICRRTAARLGLTGDELDRRVGDLSLGRARLSEIATTLVGAPRVLVLDEPSVGLTEDELLPLSQVIRAIADDGALVIVIDHDLEFLRLVVDRVLAAVDGRIVADGPLDEVLDVDDLRAVYLGVEVDV